MTQFLALSKFKDYFIVTELLEELGGRKTDYH